MGFVEFIIWLLIAFAVGFFAGLVVYDRTPH